MQTLKYLCEFFFDDFWHFMALLILIDSIPFGWRFMIKKKQKEDEAK